MYNGFPVRVPEKRRTSMQEMETRRDRLHRAILSGQGEEEILRISRALDKLIVAYYRAAKKRPYNGTERTA